MDYDGINKTSVLSGPKLHEGGVWNKGELQNPLPK